MVITLPKGSPDGEARPDIGSGQGFRAELLRKVHAPSVPSSAIAWIDP